MKTLFVSHQQMISGYAEQTKREYRMFVGKSGLRWLVANQPNEGDNVYVEGGPGSNGFGGATLTFKLIDGGEVNLRGPWHSNSSDLFLDTGHDARAKHLTYGIIAEKRERVPYRWDLNYYDGVIHKDEEPTLGTYSRIETAAREWSNRNKKDCYYEFVSKGGSSAGIVKYKETVI